MGARGTFTILFFAALALASGGRALAEEATTPKKEEKPGYVNLPCSTEAEARKPETGAGALRTCGEVVPEIVGQIQKNLDLKLSCFYQQKNVSFKYAPKKEIKPEDWGNPAVACHSLKSVGSAFPGPCNLSQAEMSAPLPDKKANFNSCGQFSFLDINDGGTKLKRREGKGREAAYYHGAFVQALRGCKNRVLNEIQQERRFHGGSCGQAAADQLRANVFKLQTLAAETKMDRKNCDSAAYAIRDDGTVDVEKGKEMLSACYLTAATPHLEAMFGYLALCEVYTRWGNLWNGKKAALKDQLQGVITACHKESVKAAEYWYTPPGSKKKVKKIDHPKRVNHFNTCYEVKYTDTIQKFIDANFKEDGSTCGPINASVSPLLLGLLGFFLPHRRRRFGAFVIPKTLLVAAVMGSAPSVHADAIANFSADLRVRVMQNQNRYPGVMDLIKLYDTEMKSFDDGEACQTRFKAGDYGGKRMREQHIANWRKRAFDLVIQIEEKVLKAEVNALAEEAKAANPGVGREDLNVKIGGEVLSEIGLIRHTDLSGAGTAKVRDLEWRINHEAYWYGAGAQGNSNKEHAGSLFGKIGMVSCVIPGKCDHLEPIPEECNWEPNQITQADVTAESFSEDPDLSMINLCAFITTDAEPCPGDIEGLDGIDSIEMATQTVPPFNDLVKTVPKFQTPESKTMARSGGAAGGVASDAANSGVNADASAAIAKNAAMSSSRDGSRALKTADNKGTGPTKPASSKLFPWLSGEGGGASNGSGMGSGGADLSLDGSGGSKGSNGAGGPLQVDSAALNAANKAHYTGGGAGAGGLLHSLDSTGFGSSDDAISGDGATPDGELTEFGERSLASAEAGDPADYFERSSSFDSLFKMVEKRYQQKNKSQKLENRD